MVDTLIVPAGAAERKALMDQLPEARRQLPGAEDLASYWTARLRWTANNREQERSIVVMSSPRQADPTRALAGARTRWEPRSIIFFAAAPPLTGGQAGDVLIGARLIDLAGGARKPFAIDASASPLFQRAQTIDDGRWQSLIAEPRERDLTAGKQAACVAFGVGALDAEAAVAACAAPGPLAITDMDGAWMRAFAAASRGAHVLVVAALTADGTDRGLERGAALIAALAGKRAAAPPTAGIDLRSLLPGGPPPRDPRAEERRERAEAAYLKGAAAFQSGELEAALRLFTEAIEIDPDYAEAYSNRGAIKAAKDELEGAIADYNTAIHINPGLGPAHYNLACAHCLNAARRADDIRGRQRMRLELERAIECLEKAVQLGFDDRAHLARDPDLAALRDHERFRRLLEP